MRALIVCLLSLCFVCFTSFVFAAPPNAGTLLQDNRQRPQLPSKSPSVVPNQTVSQRSETASDVKIAVSEIRLSGVDSVPLTEVQALVAGAAGQVLTLEQLDTYAGRITGYYHDAGYPLARAYVPAQKIIDGRVELAVLEGRIGKITIDNQSTLADQRVADYLDTIESGEIFDSATMEKDLLLLSDIKGIKVSSSLRPGESVGTTDLDIQVAPGKPYSGHVFLDNYGNSYTGDWRGGADVTLGNLASLGDSLSLNANKSKDLTYGRASWQVPLGANGTQLGTALSLMHYRLGKDYKDLDAHGDAVMANLYLLHPLIRSRRLNLNSQLVYTHKRLDDDIDSVDTRTRKNLDVCTFGLSADHDDAWWGGGLTQAHLSVSAGHLDLDDDSHDLDAAGYRTAGDFTKLNAGAARLQRLSDHWSLLAEMRGQLAAQNLDSAEKISLGGPTAVRAYPQGEAPADDAWLATLELRYRIKAQWQASAFYDHARGRINHKPLSSDTDNARRLAGYGLGLAYAQENYRIQLGMAWRSGDRPVSDSDKRPRVWVQAVRYF